MTLPQLMSLLPVLKLEAMLEHRYFDATWIKKQEEDVKNFIRMNNYYGVGEQYDENKNEMH